MKRLIEILVDLGLDMRYVILAEIVLIVIIIYSLIAVVNH